MRAVRFLRVGVFVAVIVAPLVTMRAGGAATTLANEQRSRAAWPRLAVAREQYPEQFDAFFRDSFGWRDQMIRWHHLFKYRFLDESPVANVIVGRDGWLFYAAESDGIDIRDFAGRWPYDDHTIDRWLVQQEQRRVEYEKSGARYLIAFAPNKQTIYPERMPRRYGPHAPGVLDAVMRRAALFPHLAVVDLRERLSGPHETPTFYKGDSHWNANGAFEAAVGIADRVRQRLPATGELRRADYSVTARPIDTGDLVRMMNLGISVEDRAYEYRRLSGPAENIATSDLHRQWENRNRTLPRALLLGDSFGGELAPRLADAFSTLHYYYSMRGGLDTHLVATERPDVVILLLVERYLPFLESQ